jgi:hypothetical protein
MACRRRFRWKRAVPSRQLAVGKVDKWMGVNETTVPLSTLDAIIKSTNVTTAAEDDVMMIDDNSYLRTESCW